MSHVHCAGACNPFSTCWAKLKVCLVAGKVLPHILICTFAIYVIGIKEADPFSCFLLTTTTQWHREIWSRMIITGLSTNGQAVDFWCLDVWVYRNFCAFAICPSSTYQRKKSLNRIFPGFCYTSSPGRKWSLHHLYFCHLWSNFWTTHL